MATFPDFPDFQTWQQALTQCDEELVRGWDRAMGERGKQSEFVCQPDRLPSEEPLGSVRVRVPSAYNWMTEGQERVARLWIESRSGNTGLTGNTVAFPIPISSTSSNLSFTDFVFTDIAVFGPAGRYRFIFQLMVKDFVNQADPSLPAQPVWNLLTKKRSTAFELGNYLAYDFRKAQDALSEFRQRARTHMVNFDPTEPLVPEGPITEG